jgi:uncharacterized zinc-type alcohol dehydrogenase-like protein
MHRARFEAHSMIDTFGRTQFPLVPGHEIVGRVVETGRGVSRFKVGNLADVGCIADSCRTCASCRARDEQHCADRFTLSFGAVDWTGARMHGGYAIGRGQRGSTSSSRAIRNR